MMEWVGSDGGGLSDERALSNVPVCVHSCLRVSRLMMTKVAAALSVPDCLKLSRIANRSTLTTGSGIFCCCSEAPLG